MGNFKWKQIFEKGQYSNGFIDIFESIIDGNRAVAIINFLPQFEDTDQKVLTTILLEHPKHNWTEGKIKSILFDCEDYVKNLSSFRFRVIGELHYMTIQTLFIEKIDNLQLGNFGDFSFII